MAEAKRDNNMVTTLIGVSSVDGITPITIYVDPVTHRLLVSAIGGSYLSTAPENLSAQCNGSNLIFTTTRDVNSIIFCSLNGTLLLEGKEVSITGTKEITLTFAPASGEEFYLKYI